MEFVVIVMEYVIVFMIGMQLVWNWKFMYRFYYVQSSGLECGKREAEFVILQGVGSVWISKEIAFY